MTSTQLAPAAPGKRVLDAKAVDPKVITAAVTPVAAWLATVVVAKITAWHVLGGITGGAYDALRGLVGALILAVLVFVVGYSTRHGRPLLDEAEAKIQAEIGPDQFAVIRDDFKTFVKNEAPALLAEVVSKLDLTPPAPAAPVVPVTVNVTPAPVGAVEVAPDPEPEPAPEPEPEPAAETPEADVAIENLKLNLDGIVAV